MTSSDGGGARDRTSMKALASQVASVIRDLGTSTSENIAAVIINRLSTDGAPPAGQDTIRRRIYDIINVISASGLITKAGKNITWSGCLPSIPNTNETQQNFDFLSRIKSKSESLEQKLKRLIFYKALIKKNYGKHASPDAIHLPVLIIGAERSEAAAIQRSENTVVFELYTFLDRFFGVDSICSCLSFDENELYFLRTASPEIQLMHEYSARLSRAIRA